MKVTVSTQDFLAGLEAVSPACKRATGVVPTLGAVRLRSKAQTNELCLAATDFELEIQTGLDIETGDDGVVVVPYDVLQNFVRSTPDGTLALVEHDGTVTVTGEQSSLALRSIVEEFPELSAPPTKISGIDVDWSQVARVLPFCAAPTSAESPILRSVHVANGQAIGFDSKRFAVADVPLPDGFGSVNLPASALRVAQGQLYAAARRAWFVTDRTVLSTTLMSGEYPVIQKYLDRYEWQHTLTVEREDLLAALTVVKGTLDAKSIDRRVIVVHDGDTLHLSCRDPNGNVTAMDLSAAGEPFESGFNCSMLEDFVKALREDTIAIQHGTPDTLIKAEEDGFTVGLMRLVSPRGDA